jgi:large subunit ribosomal protein L30
MNASSNPKSDAGKADAHKLVTVTLLRSIHGQLKHIASSVRGLGLRRRHQSVIIADTAANRGMMNTAGHLLKVESK